MPKSASNLPTTLEGRLVPPPGARFAIVAPRFNGFIVDSLLGGARDALLRHGVPEERITAVRVPGSWEVPAVCRRLAGSGRFDAVIAVGAVIRGATAHFEHVASTVARGVAEAGRESGVPVTFGVLTTDTIEQAVERAGTKAGNKGFDAAVAAIELVSLGARMKELGL